MNSEERHTLVGVVSRKLFESNCNQVIDRIISKCCQYFLPLSPRRASTPTWPSTSTGSRTRWKPTEEWQPALVFWVCRPRLVTFPFFYFCVVKNLTYTVSQKNALQNCHLLVKMDHSWPPDQSGIRELTSGCWWMAVLKMRFLGPRGPLVLPLVDPCLRNENLDPMYTGIYASWIIRRLIKPTLYILVLPITV